MGGRARSLWGRFGDGESDRSGAHPHVPLSAPGLGQISEAREFAPHFLNSDASALSALDMEPASPTRARERVISEVPEDKDYNRPLIRIPRI